MDCLLNLIFSFYNPINEITQKAAGDDDDESNAVIVCV